MVMDINAKKTQHSWDAAIIGGGLAGLAAAVYLTKAGKRVIVLEKGDQVGGRAITLLKDGSRINLGPHALYTNSIGMKVLQELGVEPLGDSPKSSAAEFIVNDKQLNLLSLFLGWHLNIGEKLEVLRFLKLLRTMDSSPFHHVPFRQWLDEQLRYEKSRKFATALIRVGTYTHDPDRLSAGAAIEKLSHPSVLYVKHGWGSIVQSLKEKALQNGAMIREGTSVKEMLREEDGFLVTLGDGTALRASKVISTASPKEVLSLFTDPSQLAKLAFLNKQTPVFAACLDVVLNKVPQPKTSFVLNMDQPLFYSNHSAVTELSDNPNHSVLHLMRYLSSDEQPDPGWLRIELERYLDRLQPGWREYLIFSRFLPHMTVSHGIVEAAHGGLPGRPKPAVMQIPGFYLAGDWVGDQGMLADASLNSAKMAAEAIIEENGPQTEREAKYAGAFH